MNIYPLCYGISCYPLLRTQLSSSDCLQKGEKHANGIDKLVEKVSTNLLHYVKSTACIFIDAPTVTYTHS